MTQPKQSSLEPNQHAVKEHVKAMLRKLSRNSQRNVRDPQHLA